MGKGDVEVRVGLAVDLAAFKAFAKDHDIRQSAIKSFFATLEREDVPLEDAERRLREIAEAFLKTRDRLREFQPNPSIADLLDRAKEVLEEGQQDSALELLSQIDQQANENLEALEAKLTEHKRQKSKISVASGGIYLSKLDFLNALPQFTEAVELWPEQDATKVEYLSLRAKAERELGDYAGAIDTGLAALAIELPSAEPRTRSLRHDAFKELSETYLAMGNHDAALRALNSARDSLGNQVSQEDDFGLQTKKSVILVDAGRLQQAQALLEVLAKSQSIVSSTSKAMVQFALGRLLVQGQNWGDAEIALAEAHTEFSKVGLQAHPNALRASREASYVALKLGNLEESQRLLKDAFDGFKGVFGHEDHPDFVALYDQKGFVELSLGNLPGSFVAFERAIELCKTHLGDQHPDLGQALSNFGTALLESGQLKEAEHNFRQALVVFKEAYSDRHHELAAVTLNISTALLDGGQVLEAEEYARLANELAVENYGPRHPTTVETLVQLSSIKFMRGDYAACKSIAEDVASALDGSDHQSFGALAITKINVSKCLLSEDNPAEALSLARSALRLSKRALKSETSVYPSAAYNLGEVLNASGSVRRALAAMNAGLRQSRSNFNGFHENTMRGLLNVGGLASTLGDNKLGRKALECAVVQGRSIWPNGGTLTALALSNLGILLDQENEPDTALEHFSEAVEILSRSLGKNHPYTTSVSQNLEAHLRKLEQSGPTDP